MTPESEVAGWRELLSAARASKASLRLRGLEEGGLGGKGDFNLGWEGEEGTMGFGSVFSLECLVREGLDLAEEVVLGLDEDGSSVAASRAVAFLGSMKCFILAIERVMRERRGG